MECFDKPVKHVKTSCGFVNMARKAEIARRKFFVSLNYKSFPIQSGFEQLSSSICWGVMAIYKRGVLHARLGFVSAEMLTNFGFFIDNFGYRYARKPFKGSKDAEFGLVSANILNQNIGWLGWRPGPGKVGQKKPKTPPLVTSSLEIPKSKTRNVFFGCSLRLAESVEGLNCSLAQSPGE